MNRIPKDKSLMKTISWKTKGGDYKFIKVKIQDVWFFIDSWSWKENKKEETNIILFSRLETCCWSKPWSCTDSCSTDLWTDGSSRMNASFHFSSFSRLEETKERKEKEMKTKACDSKDILCIHCLFLSFLINGNRSLSKNAFSSRNSSRFTFTFCSTLSSSFLSLQGFVMPRSFLYNGWTGAES